jgi:hypothetical protein
MSSLLIVMQKSSGITLFAQWGVPIELTMIMLITCLRAWALSCRSAWWRSPSTADTGSEADAGRPFIGADRLVAHLMQFAMSLFWK